MKKQFLNKTNIAIGSVLMSVTGASQAALDNTDILNINVGSFFTMGGGTVVAAPGFDGQNITGNEGLVLGTIQTPAGSHSGAPGTVAGEAPTVDNPWIFFGNTGMSGTESNSNVLSASGNTATVDLSGWVVAWNNLDSAAGVPTIPMGAGAWFDTTTDGVAKVTCGVDCEDGDTFTLIYSATVPDGDPSNFGNTQYLLSLTGTITDTNTAPVISTLPPIALTVLTTATPALDITSNVTDVQNNIDFSTLTILNNTCSDTPSDDNAGTISYTDTGGVATTCSFDVTVADIEGKVSNSQTVNVTITSGVPAPIAANDGSVASPIIVPENTVIQINVLDNDTAAGGIDVTSVTPTNGNIGIAVADNVTGIVTYTPDANTIGDDTLTYTFNDLLTVISNTATVTIKVNSLPIGDPGSLTLTRGGSANIVVTTSDLDGTVDLTTLTFSANNCSDTPTDDNAGRISYTDTGNVITSCSFDYTVDDNNGTTSLPATVSVSIENAIPVANNDNGGLIDIASVTNKAFDIALNDTDADGTINRSSIVIISAASNGTISLNDPTPGEITYTPDPNFAGNYPFTDSFTYTIDDNDAATSLPATVTFTVDNSIVETFPPRDAILTIEPANVGDSVLVQPEIGTGSWFSMLLAPDEFTYTSVAGLNHLQLGTSQLGQVNPTFGNIDEPWPFVGNLGIHQTTSDVLVLSGIGDGTATLDFTGWDVGWAAVPSINLSEGPSNGIASLTCTAGDNEQPPEADCSVGDRYVLDYRAIVPEGDPSNFGGVNYRLHLEGEILAEVPIFGCNDATTPYTVTDIAAGDCDGNVEGNVFIVEPGDIAKLVSNTTGTGLSVADIGVKDPRVNPDNGEQCFGGCVDYTISGVDIGGYVNVVYRLNKPIESGLIFRKLIYGKWQNFDRTNGDLIGSAATSGGMCQTQAGTFKSTLTVGDECVFMRITDGGPNDADGLANGTIVDPGGLLLAGSPNTPPSSTDGCSISGNTLNLMQRADWLLLLGFITWLGLVIRRRQV